jgi:radical SAM-linked protein
MPRLLFEKVGSSVWISHLDLMRLFQRAFKRADLPLVHSKGFNPRPSVSIALPLSVGIESRCELLDFELEGEKVDNEEILHRLNENLVSGIRVLDVYDDGRKLKHLALLRCAVTFEYDAGIPEGAEGALTDLFAKSSLIVEKHGKNGTVQQDIIPMIRKLQVTRTDDHTLSVESLICCQNPTLNPMQLGAAVEAYLPAYTADFVKFSRIEIFDTEENTFR